MLLVYLAIKHIVLCRDKILGSVLPRSNNTLANKSTLSHFCGTSYGIVVTRRWLWLFIYMSLISCRSKRRNIANLFII